MTHRVSLARQTKVEGGQSKSYFFSPLFPHLLLLLLEEKEKEKKEKEKEEKEKKEEELRVVYIGDQLSGGPRGRHTNERTHIVLVQQLMLILKDESTNTNFPPQFITTEYCRLHR